MSRPFATNAKENAKKDRSAAFVDGAVQADRRPAAVQVDRRQVAVPVHAVEPVHVRPLLVA